MRNSRKTAYHEYYPAPGGTSADVIRAILELERDGLSLKGRHVREACWPLVAAAIRHFGCWGNALKAAGIDHEAIARRRKWTVERVVQAIHRLDRQGVPLNYGSVYKADSGLPQAATKLLGSWHNALRAAGYDPDQIRTARSPWTRSQIIELIDCIALLRPTNSPGLYYQMVGRGFRIDPSKTDTLVLDFGSNILRHGPVDDLRIKERANGNGPAPARECPQCRAVIHAAYTLCPECGYEFPPPQRERHDGQASTEGILSGEVTETEYDVTEIFYSVHQKRDAPEGHPRSMRVDSAWKRASYATGASTRWSYGPSRASCSTAITAR